MIGWKRVTVFKVRRTKVKVIRAQVCQGPKVKILRFEQSLPLKTLHLAHIGVEAFSFNKKICIYFTIRLNIYDKKLSLVQL